MSKLTPQKIRSKAKSKEKRAKELKDRKALAAQSVSALNSPKFYNPRTLAAFEVNQSNAGYDFWRAHGVNYLASNYDGGLWEPVFPEIYQGSVISSEVLFRRILTHLTDVTGRLTETGLKCLLWVSLKPDELHKMVYRVHRFVKLNGGEPREPMDPHVWTFLTLTGNLMRQACAQWEGFRQKVWDMSLFDTVAEKTLEATLSEVVAEANTHSSRESSQPT